MHWSQESRHIFGMMLSVGQGNETQMNIKSTTSSTSRSLVSPYRTLGHFKFFPFLVFVPFHWLITAHSSPQLSTPSTVFHSTINSSSCPPLVELWPKATGVLTPQAMNGDENWVLGGKPWRQTDESLTLFAAKDAEKRYVAARRPSQIALGSNFWILRQGQSKHFFFPLASSIMLP